MAAAAFTTRRALLKGGLVLTTPVSQVRSADLSGVSQPAPVLFEVIEQLVQLDDSTLVIVRNMLRHLQPEAIET